MVLAADTAWAPKGYEDCFGQHVQTDTAEKTVCTKPLEIIRGDGEYTICMLYLQRGIYDENN